MNEIEMKMLFPSPCYAQSGSSSRSAVELVVVRLAGPLRRAAAEQHRPVVQPLAGAAVAGAAVAEAVEAEAAVAVVAEAETRSV